MAACSDCTGAAKLYRTRGVRQFICGTGAAGKYGAHQCIGKCMDRIDGVGILFGTCQNMLGRQRHIIEKHLALVERTLAKFVERFAA